MKRIIAILFAFLMAFCLYGCAFLEMFNDKENIVDLGDGKNFVKWNLVWNNNEY